MFFSHGAENNRDGKVGDRSIIYSRLLCFIVRVLHQREL